ncbi:BnaA08g20160D [Brassica napus]|uniref:(rape) hypothetical protein n=1 Tax=Brassica napus TaxID=3708 RepID=A0A078IAT2_BRANA|nr:unnamed protein product [Brassica napus]CDY46414.1 BnaA08g20160D [Brassica napus]
MVTTLKDGYTIQVTKREPPVKQGVELKINGIHLVYEGGDYIKGEESYFTETENLPMFSALLKKVKLSQIVNLLLYELLPSLHAQCIKRDIANYLSEICQFFSSLEKGEVSS